jgi:mannose-1-phosphate guanylyltransferase / mannose-6-phosphate isomerase
MAFYPVIMCGGAGTRLWPASRPSRPKQFIPLAGNRSLFQETVMRVAPLAREDGRLIVVGGLGHRDWIADQLAEIDVVAQVLLEPEARDSAAAMAAAAVWADRQDPAAMIGFVASDHHIPDHEAFRNAVMTAAGGAADGRVVTLGVTPAEPSQAYGYIKPAARGLSAVEAFVEKPDRELAQSYIAAGYLWNSGNFIVSAATLLQELAQHAPAVLAAVKEAVQDDRGSTLQVLGAAFSESPKISIDYAVMEKTQLASVLEVDFSWSDLGAWDAIAASGEGNTGLHIFEDAEGCLARAPDGVLVAAMGVKNLGIVVEDDAVLVCDLSKAQDVKRLVERVRSASPTHLDFHRPAPESLASAAQRFSDWLRLKALPIWATLGQADDGAFAEGLSLEGRTLALPRRARVQARQIHVYAQAGRLGWQGPWRDVVTRGLTRLYADYLRSDGLCRTLLDADGRPLDDTAMLYDQAFVLFALASAKAADVADGSLEARATALRDRLLADAPTSGGLIEAGEHPYQSNAHMHLLEACLAWEEVGGDGAWAALADRIVHLANSQFIDAQGGFLREFFDARWRPAPGDDGHQFEWAWLLARHARARSNEAGLEAARKLYRFGRGGVGDRPMIAVDAMNDDGSIRSRRARLWPQTEWLKASLILGESAVEDEREALAQDAAAALRALWLYLSPDGLWRDKHLPQGGFIDEPAPASSFYHIMAAFGQLVATEQDRGLEGLRGLTLA